MMSSFLTKWHHTVRKHNWLVMFSHWLCFLITCPLLFCFLSRLNQLAVCVDHPWMSAIWMNTAQECRKSVHKTDLKWMGYHAVMETVTATTVSVQLFSSTARDCGEKVPIHITSFNKVYSLLLLYHYSLFVIIRHGCSQNLMVLEINSLLISPTGYSCRCDDDKLFVRSLVQTFWIFSHSHCVHMGLCFTPTSQ